MSEFARARQLCEEIAELSGRLNRAAEQMQLEVLRSSEKVASLISTVVEHKGTLQLDLPDAFKLPDTNVAYSVYLEGGKFTHAKRCSAVKRYQNALNASYGSPSAVLFAMRKNRIKSDEQWHTFNAYARWSALAPHEFSGEGEFIITEGSGFNSG